MGIGKGLASYENMFLHQNPSSTSVLYLLLVLTRLGTAQSPSADLVLIHGHILTMDTKDSVVQAVAIRRGVIVKVGSDAEVKEFAGNAPGLRVIDLHGRTATPGLIDTHAHIADGGVQELYGVKLSDAGSVAEVVVRVKTKIALVKPGEWVTGAGWDEGKLSEHRYVTAADLDAVSANNPVWLVQTTGHYGVANSAALKLAHVTTATTDPAAGTIDRDAHGNPTGVLKEESAMNLVTHLIPPVTLEQMRQGILYIQQVLHSEGMTAVKDPDIFRIHWDAYKLLLEQGKLKDHICVLWHAGSTMESARKALDEINAVPRLPATLGNGRLLSCGALLGTFAAGLGPEDLAFDGANIWVTDFAGNTVTELQASSGATVGTFTVGTNPVGVVFDGANIWVANWNGGTGAGTVTELQASTGTLLGTFNVGRGPLGMAFDGAFVWTANGGLDTNDNNTLSKL